MTVGKETCGCRENRRGRQIRYVQRVYVPDEERCPSLFEAADPGLVRGVNDIVQFPLARPGHAELGARRNSPAVGLDDTGLIGDTDHAAASRLDPSGDGLQEDP